MTGPPPEAPSLPETRGLSAAERREIGRAARKEVKRGDLADWHLNADRDPIDLLEEQEDTRVHDLLPLRHQRMGANPFAFYRGSAIVMAADLASSPHTGLIVQLCGDAHLANFGLYGAPDRVPVFDINDFDETNPGPFEWDVKRLAASFILLAEQNSLPKSTGKEVARAVGMSYRRSMARFARLPSIDVWYDRVSAIDLEQWANKAGPRKSRQNMARIIDKAQSRDAWSAIQSMTEVVDGRRQFRDDAPVLVRVPPQSAVRRALDTMLDHYRAQATPDRARLLDRYEAIDWAHKVVGVGSVGLLAFVCLLRGRDDKDLMALQIKQAEASVLERYTGTSPYVQHGERVVQGQRIIQAASDSFLGWVTGELGRDYYVRQLRDMKWSPNPAKLGADPMLGYALLCGHVLARAHARSGDPIAISSYLGTATTFDEAIGDSAVSYAAVVRDDFATFTAAVASGQLVSGDGPTDAATLRSYMDDPVRMAIG